MSDTRNRVSASQMAEQLDGLRAATAMVPGPFDGAYQPIPDSMGIVPNPGGKGLDLVAVDSAGNVSCIVGGQTPGGMAAALRYLRLGATLAGR